MNMKIVQLGLFGENFNINPYMPVPINDTTKRVDQSLRLIRSYSLWKPLTLAYSGGKDSECVRHLCKLAKVPITMVHNCTTIDYPGTLSQCQKVGAIIQRPKLSFYQLVAKKGLPSMFRRFCCHYLKEMYIADTILLGIRKDESVKRDLRYNEPSSCRAFSKQKHCEEVLPIIMWSQDNLKEFILDNDIVLNPHYYVNGKLDVNQRVGCIGCPLQGDRGKKDYLAFPKHLRLLAKAYKQYVDSHKAVHSVYDDIVWQLFYSNHHDKQYQQTYHGLFNAPDSRDFLETYFKISLEDSSQ